MVSFQELSLHQDRVRSMCITDDGLVISGPSSRDGRIAVWKSHLVKDDSPECPERETKDVITCEEGDFEVVCKNDTVQFDLERNETRYISNMPKYAAY